MPDEPVVDAEVVEEPPPEAPQTLPAAPAAILAVTPQVEAAELVKRLDTIREAAETAMTDGVDFGKVPGTDKPTLLKPGAEKLGVLFQLDIQLHNEKIWAGDHLTVNSKATVFHAPTGARLGSGEGMCTTREKKYAKRRQNLKCPECGKEAVLLSKKPDEGYFCWRKKDGCGAQFPRDDERLTGQVVGEIDNPDLADTWNTVLKMAEKRARVDAVLAVTGASALFVQDMDEDVPRGDPSPAESAPELLRATQDEQAKAKQALGRLCDGDGEKAKAIYTEALGHFGDVCPKGVAVLLMRLDGAPVARAEPDTRDLPDA